MSFLQMREENEEKKGLSGDVEREMGKSKKDQKGAPTCQQYSLGLEFLPYWDASLLGWFVLTRAHPSFLCCVDTRTVKVRSFHLRRIGRPLHRFSSAPSSAAACSQHRHSCPLPNLKTPNAELHLTPALCRY